MKKYVLDTNLYVQAFRSVEGAQELEDFLADFAPATFLSSVVLHELLVGSNTPAKARQVEESIARPLKRVGRVITPSHAAWESTGNAIARMARDEKLELRTMPKSLVHDFLIATSCSEAGVTVITDNEADFRRIRKYIRVQYVLPWPE